MFPPHAYFTALDFEARAGAVFDLFLSQTGYGSGHSDPVISAIITRIEFVVVRSKESAFRLIPGLRFRVPIQRGLKDRNICPVPSYFGI